jgi:hypothetical protein
MSLFENNEYRWRETYFVLFERSNRPSCADIRAVLSDLGDRYEIGELAESEGGEFESLTLYSPMDSSAMDILLVEGEDVTDQIHELLHEWKGTALSEHEKKSINRLKQCELRLDVLHFERIVDDGEDEDEVLDPGGLLIVLEKLGKLVHGIAIDPQSGAMM